MAVGDVGIWTDSAGSQTPTTTFSTVDFATETLNQNTHYSEAAGVVTLNEAGMYLIEASMEYGGATNRMNPVATIVYTGTGSFISLQGSGYVRNGNNDENVVHTYALVVGGGASDTVACQHKRDGDSSGTSAAGASTLKVIRLHDSASVGLYQDTSSTTDPSATTWADLSLNSNILENDTASIERTGNDIAIKSTARYLIGYGYSIISPFNNNGNRTQRLVRMESGGSALNASVKTAYGRDPDNHYMSPSGMILVDNSGTTTITMQGSRQGATVVGLGPPTRETSISGVFVVELPASAEVYIGVDGTAAQNVAAAAPVTLNAMRTNTAIDAGSFTSAGTTDLTNDAGAAIDVLVWANAWATTTSSTGTRLTRGLRFELNGVDRTRGQDISFLRGTQGGEDCPDFSLSPLDVIDGWPDGEALNIETFDTGYDDGSATPTNASQVGTFAINLGTLEAAAADTTVTLAGADSLTQTDNAPSVLLDTLVAAVSDSLIQTDNVPIHTGLNGAAYAAALNTDLGIDVSLGNVTGRLIIEFQNDGSGLAQTYKIKARKNALGYADLTPSSSNIRLFSTSHLTNGDDTPQVIGSGTHLANNNAVLDTSGTFIPATLPNTNVFSLELAYEAVAADLADGDTLDFLLYYDDDTPVGPSTQVPRLNVTKTGDITINSPADAQTVSDNGPTISTGVLVSSPADAQTVADNEPTASGGGSASPPADAQTVVDNAPTVVSGGSASPPADAQTVADNAPTVASGVRVDIPADSQAVADNVPTAGTGARVEAPADAQAVTDNAPGPVSTGVFIQVGVDTLSIADNAPELRTGVRIDVPNDVMTQVDETPSLGSGTVISLPGSDSHTVVDQAPTVSSGASVSAPADSHVQTNNTPSPSSGAAVSAPQDSQSITDNVPTVDTDVLAVVTAGPFLESEIVTGGETIIIDLINDTWVTFNDTIRQAIIDGLDSAEAEATGWNAEVRDKEVPGAVVRTNATRVTITLTAAAAYAITSGETITVTVPASALTTSVSALVSAQTISVIAEGAGGISAAELVRRRREIIIGQV